MVCNSILQAGGRLKNAPASYDITHPIILTNNSHFTELLYLNITARSQHHNTPGWDIPSSLYENITGLSEVGPQSVMS